MVDTLNGVVAAALVLLGAILVWFERNRRSEIERAEPNDRPFLRGRMRRRFRVALLLMLLGAMIAATGWIDIDRRPVPYLATWFVALLVALWIFWLGFVEFFAARMHWVDRTQRNLVEIARAKNELRTTLIKKQAHKKNGHSPP